MWMCVSRVYVVVCVCVVVCETVNSNHQLSVRSHLTAGAKRAAALEMLSMTPPS